MNQKIHNHISLEDLSLLFEYSVAEGRLVRRKSHDQTVRSRWRCLLLAIKAKLECVDSGITTLEQEFMAHIVMPNGETVGEVMTPQIQHAYQTGQMPPLLGMNSNL